MTKPEDLSHLSITPEQFYDEIEKQERLAIETANSPVFREQMGDAMADDVIRIANEHLANLAKAREQLTGDAE